ncbi:hypothetical protein CC2G_006523 [Coprinopsis cinerea AmutBmut pab1-1]|nr:hypothetical protein CC2G_006523 [Coprinopsis cinerea AmutBmut pab1-1]
MWIAPFLSGCFVPFASSSKKPQQRLIPHTVVETESRLESWQIDTALPGSYCTPAPWIVFGDLAPFAWIVGTSPE